MARLKYFFSNDILFITSICSHMTKHHCIVWPSWMINMHYSYLANLVSGIWSRIWSSLPTRFWSCCLNISVSSVEYWKKNIHAILYNAMNKTLNENVLYHRWALFESLNSISPQESLRFCHSTLQNGLICQTVYSLLPDYPAFWKMHRFYPWTDTNLEV